MVIRAFSTSPVTSASVRPTCAASYPACIPMATILPPSRMVSTSRGDLITRLSSTRPDPSDQVASGSAPVVLPWSAMVMNQLSSSTPIFLLARPYFHSVSRVRSAGCWTSVNPS